MRFVLLLFGITSLLTIGYGQSTSFVVGRTQDCFAGKLIHPAKVDIYLLDPDESREVVEILADMEKQMPRNDDQNPEAFFESYGRLTTAIRKTNAIHHTRSSATGDFLLRGLAEGKTVLLVGLAELEDQPTYYTYLYRKLQPGRNRVTLDFDRGNPKPCESANSHMQH